MLSKLFWKLPHETRRLAFAIARRERCGFLKELRQRTAADQYGLAPFDEKKAIFVHIPKCAGVSMAKALFGNLGGGHLTIGDYALLYPKRTFDNYFKFSVVRNPWDRLVSAFYFLKSGGYNIEDKRWAEENLSAYESFEEFVIKWVTKENVLNYFHFIPQYRFICIEGHQRPMVDFIARFEDLQRGFEYVAERMGCERSLERENVRNHRRKEYQKFYCKETKEIVRSVYERDIRMLGYTFGEYSSVERVENGQ